MQLMDYIYTYLKHVVSCFCHAFNQVSTSVRAKLLEINKTKSKGEYMM